MTLNIIPQWQVQMFMEKIDQRMGIDSVVNNTALGYFMGQCNIPLTRINEEYLRFLLNNIDDIVERGEEDKL